MTRHIKGSATHIGTTVSYSTDCKEEEPKATAVIVCHGMGQQVNFETLQGIVDLFRAGAELAGSHINDVAVRLVTMNAYTSPLGRAEFTITRSDGTRKLVHVHEVYWAPITEGHVVVRDVL